MRDDLIVKIHSLIRNVSILKYLLPALLLTLATTITTPGFAETDDTSETIKHPHSVIVFAGKGLSLHKEMYILPASISNEYNDKQTEVIFQISAKQQLFDTNFYFGYTQKSFWQAYDFENSSPFRETNYNPEIFYRLQSGTILPDFYGMDIGFEHESNGQKEPISRSWNRLYAAPYYLRGNFILYAKCWYRIPEDEKETPTASKGDENPDITDYLGYTELRCYYQFWKQHLVHTMIRGNLRTGKGAVSINYSIPVPNGNSFIVCHFFNGYGESLIDYNKSITRFGIGIMFKR